MRPTRMSNVDAAWLGMDEPENLMMITAVLWFAEPVDWDRLHDVVGVRLLKRYPKFSQRAVPSTTPFEQPVWEDDPAFDLADHVERVTLATPADGAQLAALASRLMSRPLDMRHSPWQIQLVDGYGDGAAVIARLHHCIADGIALGSVLLSLTDDSPDEPADDGAEPASRNRRSARRPGLVNRVVTGVTEVFTVVGLAVTRLLLTPRQAIAAVRYGVAVVSTTLRILAFSRDPRTRFRGRLGVRKGAAWTRPHSLRAVEDIAAALGVTVNDVLLAATAGALRSYLLAYGDRAHDLRVFVPVNLRPLDQPVSADLGNRFGLVFLRLPVAEPDPVARVRAVHERMRPVKASYEAAATFAILSILGALPAWAHMLAVRILGSKSTAIVTNVPGPRQQVFLAGSPLDGVVFWVPQAGSVSLGVSIFSYSDTVTVGVAADSGLVADPRVLADAVEAELTELSRLTASGGLTELSGR